MGQNRSDTSIQLAAKRRRAERTRCPECRRGSALRTDSDSWNEPDGTTVRVIVTECRWKDTKRCTYSHTRTLRTPPPASNP
ncbi:hypothetical protein ACFWGI_37930 [Streptomyces niveus]|uniref:hypothetical protein n=1 Tax=Streptomyces niveus TaxID=193462 RepID=UPI0036622334